MHRLGGSIWARIVGQIYAKADIFWQTRRLERAQATQRCFAPIEAGHADSEFWHSL
jgi:hypothetical protein